MAFRKGIEIPYAVRAGKIVHVSEVARGLICGCVCPRCGAELVARLGALREHHFAHFRESDCPGAAESLLHRLAKELLSNAQALALPAYIYRATRKRFGVPASIEREIFAATRMSISGVAVEQPLGAIVPDLLLRSGEKDVILEIAVSHPVDRAKLRQIRRMNIPALELGLLAADVLLSPTELSQRLVEDTSIKSWLFHPEQRSVESEWVATRRRIGVDAWARAANYRVESTGKRPPPPKQGSNSDWRRWNDWAEWFSRKRGRYPTTEETRAFEQKKRG
jgi:Competence protein CoiA-like family